MTTPLFLPEDTDAIERQINDHFKQAITRAQQTNASYHHLWTTLHGLIRAGGKRFRPHMTILAYRLFGGSDAATIIPIAAAQELLHLSLLIHDDIIDRDDVRYSVPNISGHYKAYYQKHVPDDHDLTHFAHSAAILAGDLLLAGAFELIIASPGTTRQKTTAHQLLGQAVFNVVGGELLDTEASFSPYRQGDALAIALHKTAYYSFVTPLLTGAALADATAAQQRLLQEYAESLGVAYQLVDDLLGVFGSEQQTGKSTLGDIREGKRTYLVEQALEAMTASEKTLFNQAFGNHRATPDSIIQAKALLQSTGARDRTTAMIERHKQQARRAAGALGLDRAKHDQLLQLVTLVTERTA